ncbi:hypothetical protein [Herbaspirillum sp.]|uniref:hypothetical protein n=1 Tax=Herbaspirillum sp. TaxID=1890675 RepID=UPI001B1DF789|nr:hypothetical protein [Herbaspirillum sp.]MBO9535495.1 hypothetical protein [Herbaspirillum sp.]
MGILDQILSYGALILSWYALYVVIAGGVFAAYLVYRLWLHNAFFRMRGADHRSRHREMD